MATKRKAKKDFIKPGPKPITFSEEDIAKIKRLAAVFMNREEIATIMGISKTTFYELIKKDPRITNALEVGPRESKAAILSKLVQKAVKGEQRAIEFVAERKLGWVKDVEPAQTDVHFVVEMTPTGKFKHSRPKQVEVIDIDVEEKEIKEIEEAETETEDEREEW